MYTYLAILKSETLLNEEVSNYFLEKGLTISQDFSFLGIIKLTSETEIDFQNIDYISYATLDKKISLDD